MLRVLFSSLKYIHTVVQPIFGILALKKNVYFTLGYS